MKAKADPGPFISPPPSRVASVRRPPAVRARTVTRKRPIESSHPISQDLFRDALLREHRRADRFEEPFVLILISFNRRTDRQLRWQHLLETLPRTKLDGDVIGWFEQDSVLGVIRSLAGGDPIDMATALAGTIRCELVRCLTPASVDGCSIRLEIYSPHSDTISSVLAEAGDQHPTLQQAARNAAKRLLDIAGSMTFLVAFSPVFLITSVLVKLTSKGPVFFRQQRIGEVGRPFMMLKFRTMDVNADPVIHQQYVEHFIESAEPAKTGKHEIFKIVDDRRVTPLGHFLRRSSLDELPQFWNVLKGEMSLVGPRPPLPYEVAHYKPWHHRRVLEAKPGITGLWQVTGRSRTTFDDMVRLDLRYAKHYSVWTDLKILLATPRAVISGKGAY